ncbi:hypothetical protein JYT14_00095 [Flavobacteriales bacterium AH-315-E23]|nr:hypothetical protein [Flavobacteriales bacterium AH-315-E23]
MGLILLVACPSVGAQDNALVLANSKTKQFRHIKMNRWIMIKLKGGTKYHSWFMKEVNDSSIVMAHGHVIVFDEITNLREITEMHLVLRFAAPIFFLPFGVVVYAVGLKDGKDTPLSRQIGTYTISSLCALASLAPWVVQPKEYEFSGNWYLGSGTMPKKLFKRSLKQPKGKGG